MQGLLKISGLLLLVVASASAICSKGCPDVDPVAATVLKVPQLTYVHAINYAVNGSTSKLFKKLGDNVLQHLNCTTSYQAQNRRLAEMAYSQLVSFRSNDDQQFGSIVNYVAWNNDKMYYEMFDELQDPVTPFYMIPVYNDEATNTAAIAMCMPIYPSDLETCYYEWALLGTTPLDAATIDGAISKLKDLGLDVSSNLAVYSQDGCN
jgi:hypothetical protein